MPKLLQREEVIQNHPAHSDVMPSGVDPQPFAKLTFLFQGGDRWRGHPNWVRRNVMGVGCDAVGHTGM